MISNSNNKYFYLKLTDFSNYLQTTESVKELSGCSQLSVLDLSANKLEESGDYRLLIQFIHSFLFNSNIQGVYDILASIPELHVLSLANNNIIRETKDYRYLLSLSLQFHKYIPSL